MNKNPANLLWGTSPLLNWNKWTVNSVSEWENLNFCQFSDFHLEITNTNPTSNISSLFCRDWNCPPSFARQSKFIKLRTCLILERNFIFYRASLACFERKFMMVKISIANWFFENVSRKVKELKVLNITRNINFPISNKQKLETTSCTKWRYLLIWFERNWSFCTNPKYFCQVW